MTWVPPQEFEEYRLVRMLGAGGMGQVWLAHDTLLDRAVAVKFIAALEPGSDQRDRFLVEARAAARVQHPNVVATYRVGEIDHRPYIVSEYVRGESLAELPRPIPWLRALELGVELARGLAAAHRQGVLHRDLKPGNAVLTEQGSVKLLDFGLAKLVDSVALTEDHPARVGSEVASIEWDPASPASPPPNELPLSPRAQGQAATLALPAAAPLEPKAVTRILPLAETAPSLVMSNPVTRAGTVMGTPSYMAPELWRGEAGTRQSDVYSLGALLHELITGGPPHDEAGDLALADLAHRAQTVDVSPVTRWVPDVDERFAKVVELCLRRDPDQRFASGDELREALEQVAQARQTAGVAVPEGNPYRGLLSFEAEHRALFFGRGPDVRAIVERLRAEPFVLCAGDSGVGKSSLCRAGVLPLVAENALGDGRTWRALTMVPGRHPVATLASLLAPVLGRDEETIAARLRGADPEAPVRDLRRFLLHERGLLLFIDQAEELVTVSDPADAAVIGRLIARLAAGVTGVRVLSTVRGDFLTRIAVVPALGDEVGRAFHLLRPLSAEAIREAIVGPAHVKGVRFESEALVDTLVDSTVAAAGGLPLLQFALAELWDARDAEAASITAAALESIGGVAGALARHADGVVSGLLPPRRAAARRILVRLVTAQGTRARRSEAELAAGEAEVSAALGALVRGRLVVAREQEGSLAYELAHEALLSGWATLRRWLDENADERAARERLATAATEWDRLGRTRDALFGPRQLAEARTIDAGALSARDVEFLDVSRRVVRRGRLYRLALFVGAPLALIVAIGAVRLVERRGSERRRAEAARVLAASVDAAVADASVASDEARRGEKEAARLRAESFAAWDARAVDRGEEAWERARLQGEAADRSWARAEQRLEQARVADPSRQDVRALLADVLFARALIADLEGRTAQRDEHIARLALHDGGGRVPALRAPGRLHLALDPPSAEITLERFTSAATGRHVREPVAVPPGAATIEVPPGSYLLTLRASGRAELRHPVLVGRGEALHLALELPRSTAVPPGFVPVAAGRFLFGSSEEALRKPFFRTAALHRVDTKAYLIARHETTFAEWIAFLEALAPEERAKRTPAVTTSVGFRGGVSLVKLEDGAWQLTMAPTDHAYTARAGEPIRYQERATGAELDWLQAPVVGISAEDARAYAAWLATSGRVPHARLCTEYEWERAARGADGRPYPHGDRLEAGDANYEMTYGKNPLAFGPDAVGSHPVGASPYGLDDMCGNVWELTDSSLSEGVIVAKGGAYYADIVSANAANRELPEATYRDITVGIRICADPAQ